MDKDRWQYHYDNGLELGYFSPGKYADDQMADEESGKIERALDREADYA
jgi:hypothetical protein